MQNGIKAPLGIAYIDSFTSRVQQNSNNLDCPLVSRETLPSGHAYYVLNDNEQNRGHTMLYVIMCLCAGACVRACEHACVHVYVNHTMIIYNCVRASVWVTLLSIIVCACMVHTISYIMVCMRVCVCE